MNTPRITPTFVTESFYTAGHLQSDREIFDFTDSRFIRPPAHNGRNFPTLSLVEEIVLGNIVAPSENNDLSLYLPVLPSGKQTIHHQSFLEDNQVRDRAMPFRSGGFILLKIWKIHLTRKCFLNG